MLSLIRFKIFLAVINLTIVNGLSEKECGTKYIIDYNDIKLLKDCEIITGNLALNMVNEIDEIRNGSFIEGMKNYSFPLREVTGYMMIYMLDWVNSLGNLFPNLTVIRGQRLFSNYALTIHSTSLKEISLRNLLKINRGSVRIDGKNEKLCLPKIDWDSIITNGKLVIGGVSSHSSNCSWMNFTRCHTCSVPDKCWNSRACQRFESSFLPSEKRKKKCHELCLGDCTDSSSRGCYTCKDISEDGACVEQCSDTKYLNVDSRRCLSGAECGNKNRVVHENLCVGNCPAGFSSKLNASESNVDDKNYHCIKCRQKCPKFCVPPEIRSVSQLEDLGTGCSIINGSLEIRIFDDVSNITAELKTYLGDVEEIWGVLKIHRSPPITELTFLNNLRLIKGKENKTGIYIFENQNLQTIFDWRTRGNLTLNLVYGSIHIYNNLLLCQHEAERFAYMTFSEAKVENWIKNNGAKNKCGQKTIKTKFEVLSYERCLIRWENLSMDSTLGFKIYIIQFVEIKDSSDLDATVLLERDSCSSYGWQQVYVNIENLKHSKDGLLEFNLTGLKQYTTYAFSVQTYDYGTNDSIIDINKNPENSGAISVVKIFTTLMNIPSRVKNIKTLDKGSSFIQLQWNLVKNEERAIKFFYFYVSERPFNQDLIDRRNYCTHPIEIETEIYVEDYHEVVKDESYCCEICCKTGKTQRIETSGFEDELQKLSQRIPRPRARKFPKTMNHFSVDGELRNYTISNLKPYTLYRFYIVACSKEAQCSDYEFYFDITDLSSDETFDRVTLQPTANVFDSEQFLARFEEPKLKNGVIVSYVIEVWKFITNSSILHETMCITRQEHQRNRFEYSLNHLQPGKYGLRVMAVSLARKGPFTDIYEFDITKTEHSLSKGWIILFVFIALLVVVISFVSFYYKHKIMTILTNYNDRVHLLQDIEPTNFEEMSVRHNSDDDTIGFNHFQDLEDIWESDE